MNARLSGFESAGAGAGRRVVVGLTGPIASGKSTVAAMLRERGAEVIDADEVYRSLLATGSPLATAVIDRFGPTILRRDGEIDRAALGAIVFDNPAALADLERLTHPAVVAEVRRLIAGSAADVVVVEAVKLIQSGLLADVDCLWHVTAEPAVRLRRLMQRGALEESQARARIAASSDVVPMHVSIDVTIDNSGDRAATARAVEAAWQTVCGKSQVQSVRIPGGPSSREEGPWTSP